MVNNSSSNVSLPDSPNESGCGGDFKLQTCSVVWSRRDQEVSVGGDRFLSVFAHLSVGDVHGGGGEGCGGEGSNRSGLTTTQDTSSRRQDRWSTGPLQTSYFPQSRDSVSRRVVCAFGPVQGRKTAGPPSQTKSAQETNLQVLKYSYKGTWHPTSIWA